MKSLAFIIIYSLVVCNAQPQDAAFGGPNLFCEISDYEDLYSKSKYWPFRTHLLGQITSGEQTIKTGTSGVLVRMESPDKLLVDFGRDGVHSVDSSLTDILDRGRRICTGELSKDYPNFVLHVGQRIAKAIEGKPSFLKFEEVSEHPLFLMIYASRESLEKSNLSASLETLNNPPYDGKVLSFLMPVGFADDLVLIKFLADLEIELPFFLSHLAPHYIPIFQHDRSTLPKAVLSDSNGKNLLDRSIESPEDFSSLLGEISDYLPE